MFSNTEVECYTYELKTSTGSSVLPTPEWLSLDDLSMSLHPKEAASIGSYRVIISTPEKSSCSALGQENSFVVNILNGPCADTSFIETKIDDIVIQVNSVLRT